MAYENRRTPDERIFGGIYTRARVGALGVCEWVYTIDNNNIIIIIFYYFVVRRGSRAHTHTHTHRGDPRTDPADHGRDLSPPPRTYRGHPYTAPEQAGEDVVASPSASRYRTVMYDRKPKFRLVYADNRP